MRADLDSAPRLGIVGGGQLARMTHQAAISLGVEVTVLCEEADAPAVRAGARHLAGRPDDLGDLRRLAEVVDVVTLDHERTPAEVLSSLEDLGIDVAPGSTAARLGQDKTSARRHLSRRGVPMAPWTSAADPSTVESFAAEHGWPLVLKRPSGGYDGRGVWVVADLAAASEVIDGVGEVLVEPRLPLDHELAVVIARSRRGDAVAYPVVETVQSDGQCDEAFVPASTSFRLSSAAQALAEQIAHLVDLVGVMAVELFVVEGALLLNELAVRPHNSGHLTLEACTTSQFENLVRAALGMPLGATDLLVPAACMANVLGTADGRDPLGALDAALAIPGVAVHRYGKAPRPSRKLGHVTATGRDVLEVRRRASQARRAMVDRMVPA